VSNTTPNVGDTISFTVTLKNTGPNAASNVTVQDLLPVGLTFIAATPSLGTYDNVAGVWTVGTVASVPGTLTIQARVSSPFPLTNTATISHSDQFDPEPSDNQASAAETPQIAELALARASVTRPPTWAIRSLSPSP